MSRVRTLFAVTLLVLLCAELSIASSAELQADDELRTQDQLQTAAEPTSAHHALKAKFRAVSSRIRKNMKRLKPRDCIRDVRDFFKDCLGDNRRKAVGLDNLSQCYKAVPTVDSSDSSTTTWQSDERDLKKFKVAPAVIGFTSDINNICKPGKCGKKGLSRLAIFGDRYDACVNLQWTYCAAKGDLPYQRGPHIFFATHPAKMLDKYADSITTHEVCLLYHLCKNGPDLFNSDDGHFTCDFEHRDLTDFTL